MAYSARDDYTAPTFFKSYNSFAADIDLRTEGPENGYLPCAILIISTDAEDVVLTDDHGNTATVGVPAGIPVYVRCAPAIIESATAITGDIVVFWQTNVTE